MQIGRACGVRVDGPGRPKVLKVLRFDGPFGPKGCGIAFRHACGVKVQRFQKVQRGRYRLAAMSFIIPLRGMENHTTAPAARWKCTPLGAAHHFPRRGKF